MADNEKRGLTPEQVEAARARYGRNVFSKRAKKSFWRVFFGNLGDPVIKVLLFALALHLLLLFRDGDWVETVGIAASVLLATLISTLSEYRSEAAFGRLNDSCGAERCRVWRGHITELDSAELVVGDTVLLGAGERVPADGILLSGRLLVDQSPLTGESREVEKRFCKYPPKRGEKMTPAEENAVFAGCTVLSGECELRVTAVGDATFLGGISGELQSETRESPLKLRLARLARQISAVGYVLAIVCALAYFCHQLIPNGGWNVAEMTERLRNLPYVAELLLHALTLGLTVVVVAVPEGLPMMIAVVLSSNIRRMVRDHVLVRKPVGLEAAGSMNILFTDKTGTLTAGKLTVSGILTADGDCRDPQALLRRSKALFERVMLSAHANSGAVRGQRDGAAAALGGNATDRALLTAFLPFSPPVYGVKSRQPFDSGRKFAATELEDGRVLLTGAPERLLPRVRQAVGEDGGKKALDRAAFLARVRVRMGAGERVILLCEGDVMPGERLEGELTLLCAVAFSDPIRPEAREAVRTLQGAGVQVVMMTGDGKETAAEIAAACGILRRDGVVLEGSELAAMSDAELTALLPRLAVICRALPADKSRLVKLSEGAGLVVGMTGDGINDAPALRLADVGFAMGSGTQVAKDAGDIVILDDNLASVCRAVLYGRTIFKSIRKFITLQLIMNYCAVGISIIGPFIGFDAPVTVVQMLWINIVMDTLGGLAFAGEAPMAYYMKESPKRREEPILTRGIVGRITVLTLATLLLFVFFLKSPWVRSFYRESEGDLCLLTAFFALFIFASVLNCFNARTDRVRLLSGVGRNKAFLLIVTLVAAVQVAFIYLGGAVLRTVPLTVTELLFTLALALLTLPIGFLHTCARRLGGKGGLY
ncbi:MAG: calcium-translocating P-type ATPase, PMCA-type [Clostridia bacterium]|nr:calcium-translocating P-type ATPase, PMCA-type [Clostridia bacterium]